MLMGEPQSTAPKAAPRKIVRSIVRRKFNRGVLLTRPEFEDLPEHSRRHGRNRIDAKHRLAGCTDDFIGYADQPLIAAASQEKADDRDLAEHIVQAVHWNEGAAHSHLVAGIIDAALDGRSDCRALHDTLPDGELAVLPRKFRAKPGERNPVLNGGRSARGDPVKRTLPFDGEIADVD